jgi:twitching motility protein PilT
MGITIDKLLEEMLDNKATDLHLTADHPAHLRIDELLVPVADCPPLSAEEIKKMTYSFLTTEQIEKFEQTHELDVGIGRRGMGRFRVNVFVQQKQIGAAIRLLPEKILSFQECGLPAETMENIIRKPKGLVIVTGATGSGKSTTLAAMIERINQIRSCHIVTIEDPIEYTYQNKKAIIDQREIGSDTYSYTAALRHVLRQDPDVILVGEMRDLETIESAINIAETGHLVLSTLHTSDAVQTINRIIDVFESHKQDQVRVQLSFVLQAVITQQLIPKQSEKGRVLALELLIVNHAIRALIREKKVHQIYSAIQTAQKEGMRTMNQSLYELYINDLISYDEAISRTLEPAELTKLIQLKR